ncbi:MAG: hypothetical protein AB8B79_09480 [Granulosicoccus sp.]
MNTTAHLLVGLACFAKPKERLLTTAAIAGALLPDLSLYLLAGVSIVILGIEPQVVFDELYYSSGWQRVFSIDNSFLLWGALLILGMVRRVPWLIALGGAACLHIATDFLLHNDDARVHFWPLSDWRFFSPVSYWDSRFHANWVAPLEGLVCFGMLLVLFRRFTHHLPRILFALCLLVELYVLRQWLLFF